MSNAVSALEGEEYQGFITLRECGLQGMVTLRADLGAAAVGQAVQSETGHELPGPRGIRGGAGDGVAWMSPDEVMLFCAYDAAQGLAARLGQKLAGHHHLAVNVSDARVMIAVEGAAAWQVLAKLAPVDLAPGQFGPRELRRTRLAQVPAAFWAETPVSFRLVTFRSVARYAMDALKLAARPGGEVGLG